MLEVVQKTVLCRLVRSKVIIPFRYFLLFPMLSLLSIIVVVVVVVVVNLVIQLVICKYIANGFRVVITEE